MKNTAPAIPTEKIVKFFKPEIKKIDKENYRALITLSDQTMDSYQEIIDINGWMPHMKRFNDHSILLSSHNYNGLRNQIGVMETPLIVEDGKLMGWAKYFVGKGNAEADWAWVLVENNTAAFSVGFMTKNAVWWDTLNEDQQKEARTKYKITKDQTPRRIYLEQELLENSQVVIGANPNALQNCLKTETDSVIRRSAEDTLALIKCKVCGGYIKELSKCDNCGKCGECKKVCTCKAQPADATQPVAETVDAQTVVEKNVIPYQDLGIVTDESTSWSGSKETSTADVTTLKKICAWYDETKADNKTSYKLPHHQAHDNKAVWKGVNSAMGALLGARGGVQIPSEDRKGTYNHLSKHYAQFGKDVPEFKEYTPDELKAMFPEETITVEEVNKTGELIIQVAEHIKQLQVSMDDIKKSLKEVKEVIAKNPVSPLQDKPVASGDKPKEDDKGKSHAGEILSLSNDAFTKLQGMTKK